jgi:hypothetical protein
MDFEQIFLTHKKCENTASEKFKKKVDDMVKQEFNIVVSEENKSRIQELQDIQFKIKSLQNSLMKCKNLKNRNSPLNIKIRDRRILLKTEIAELQLRIEEIQMEKRK